jgi:hypothetical protein
VDIDLKFLRFTTVPNHSSMVVIVGSKHEQNKADSEPPSDCKVPAVAFVT